MARMAVDRATFVPATTVAAERLGDADLGELLELYSAYAESAFTPDQLSNGVFYGVRDGGRLVAAGGTHVVAVQYGIAAVGNVYTTPQERVGAATAGRWRRQSRPNCWLARAPEVILNVNASNASAIAIYRQLGFGVHCPSWRRGRCCEAPRRSEATVEAAAEPVLISVSFVSAQFSRSLVLHGSRDESHGGMV